MGHQGSLFSLFFRVGPLETGRRDWGCVCVCVCVCVVVWLCDCVVVWLCGCVCTGTCLKTIFRCQKWRWESASSCASLWLSLSVCPVAAGGRCGLQPCSLPGSCGTVRGLRRGGAGDRRQETGEGTGGGWVSRVTAIRQTAAEVLSVLKLERL